MDFERYQKKKKTGKKTLKAIFLGFQLEKKGQTTRIQICISLQPFKVWPRYHLKAYSVLFPLISKSQFLNLGHCD